MASSLISSVRGSLESLGPDWAEVSIGGVTLRVSVPVSTLDQLGDVGDQVRLFTLLQVRDDSLALFGFLTEEARLTFEALIGISGVGPRLALAVLSRFTPGSLAAAVRSGDTGAFSGVSGVGKKTAGRIVLELRGKLADDWLVAPAASVHGDVIDALVALGYSSAEAHEAASSLSSADSMSLEDKVRLALERIGGR